MLSKNCVKYIKVLFIFMTLNMQNFKKIFIKKNCISLTHLTNNHSQNQVHHILYFQVITYFILKGDSIFYCIVLSSLN